MASSSYYKTQLDTMAQPKFDESKYYNQSFVDKIKEAQTNIDNLVSAENQQNSKVQESQDAFDTFKGEMRHYSEISDEKENEFGVKTSLDNYNDSKDAIAATQAVINALPSSINANSNRVLTQSQREAAYQRQFTGWNKKLSIETSASSEYEKTWQQARENATRASATEYSAQQAKYNELDKAWQAAMYNWNLAQTNVLKARNEKNDWETMYRQWQHQQYNKELTDYLNTRNNLNDLYLAALQNELEVYLTNMNTASKRAESDVNTKQYISNAKIQQSNQQYAKALVSWHWYKNK